MNTHPRERTLFDADWLFAWGDVADAATADFDDASWRALHLPHDWSIEGPFDQAHPSGFGGGYLPGGIGWYRKHFCLPAQQGSARVSIVFDGVYKKCDVWLNGHHVGFRPYGYTSFHYDLTPFLDSSTRSRFWRSGSIVLSSRIPAGTLAPASTAMYG